MSTRSKTRTKSKKTRTKTRKNRSNPIKTLVSIMPIVMAMSTPTLAKTNKKSKALTIWKPPTKYPVSCVGGICRVKSSPKKQKTPTNTFKPTEKQQARANEALKKHQRATARRIFNEQQRMKTSQKQKHNRTRRRGGRRKKNS